MSRRSQAKHEALVYEIERPAMTEITIKRGKKWATAEITSTFGEPEIVSAAEAEAFRKALGNPLVRRHVPVAVNDWAKRKWFSWGRK